MSYSLQVVGKTKAEAKVAAETAYDAMAQVQTIHKRDKAAAMANVAAVIDLLVDDADKQISVSLNGYVGWRDALDAEGSNPLQSASVSASASLI